MAEKELFICPGGERSLNDQMVRDFWREMGFLDCAVEGGVMAFVSDGQRSLPVQVEPTALPFSHDQSLRVVDPQRGLVDLEELSQVAVVEETPLMSGENLPLVGRGIASLKELREGDKASKRWLLEFAHECFLQGLIPTVKELNDFIEIIQDQDARWIPRDAAMAPVMATAAWAINAAAPAITALLTKSPETTALVGGASVLLTPALVRNLYLATRVLGWEGRLIGQAYKRGEITAKELALYTAAYIGMAAGNFITFFPYLWQGAISLPRNRKAAPNYTKVEFIKLLKNLMDQGQAVREKVIGKRRVDPYHEKVYLRRLATEAREKLQLGPLVVLTAAEVGHPQIDISTLTLSRAHFTQAQAFAQAQGAEMVDVANFMPDGDHEKLEETGIKGQKVARSALLWKVHEWTAPALRRVLKLEKTFKKTAGFFAEGLASGEVRPIVAFHYGVGNAVIEALDKRKREDIPVVHYVSDPYHENGPHPPYLKHKDKKNVFYFVFDEETRQSFVNHGVPAERVFVTGFPFHPDLDLERGQEKQAGYRHEKGRKLKLAVCTGGLGGQQKEILQVADSLDFTRQQATFYCGTNYDLADKLAGLLTEKGIDVRIINPGSGVDYNPGEEATIIVGENLADVVPLSYKALNDAQVVFTKTSGDFGIEAFAGGKLLVSLGEWGRHEKDIKRLTERYGGLIPIKDFRNAGRTIQQLFEKDQLFAQVRDFWERLDNQPFFALDWKAKKDVCLKTICQMV